MTSPRRKRRGFSSIGGFGIARWRLPALVRDQRFSNIDGGFGHLHESVLNDITGIRVGFVVLATDTLLACEHIETLLNGFDSGQNPVEAVRPKPVSIGRHPSSSDSPVTGTPASPSPRWASILASAASSRSRGDCCWESAAVS